MAPLKDPCFLCGQFIYGKQIKISCLGMCKKLFHYDCATISGNGTFENKVDYICKYCEKKEISESNIADYEAISQGNIADSEVCSMVGLTKDVMEDSQATQRDKHMSISDGDHCSMCVKNKSRLDLLFLKVSELEAEIIAFKNENINLKQTIANSHEGKTLTKELLCSSQIKDAENSFLPNDSRLEKRKRRSMSIIDSSKAEINQCWGINVNQSDKSESISIGTINRGKKFGNKPTFQGFNFKSKTFENKTKVIGDRPANQRLDCKTELNKGDSNLNSRIEKGSNHDKDILVSNFEKKLFITRLVSRLSLTKFINNIKRITKLSGEIMCYKLRPKFKSYSSFYIYIYTCTKKEIN